MNRRWRNNGLSITLFGLFLTFQLGLSVVGLRQYNQEQADHQQPTVGYLEYVSSPAFLEATTENWEGEFLQMFAYILLTAFLYQKGSAEPKDPDEEEAVDRDAVELKNKEDAPWPVRRGGVALARYRNSLSLAFFMLFAFAAEASWCSGVAVETVR